MIAVASFFCFGVSDGRSDAGGLKDAEHEKV